VGNDPNDLQGPIAVDESAGQAFVSGMNGTRVVDTRRGILLATLAPSLAAVVDPASGQVFLGQLGAPSAGDQFRQDAARYVPFLWTQIHRGATTVRRIGRGPSPALP